MKNKGQQPVFPSTYKLKDGLGSEWEEHEYGISTRLYIATKMMPGLIAGYINIDAHIEISVNRAYKIADELLKQENL